MKSKYPFIVHGHFTDKPSKEDQREITKQRKKWLAQVKKHGIPTWDDYLAYQLQPDKLNSPLTAFDFGIMVFQEFCHFLDNKIGKEERTKLLNEFWEKVCN